MTSAELARSFYEAVEGGDLPGGLALLTPDCAWTEMESFGHAGVYVGADAIRDNIFVRIGTEWERFAMDVQEVLDAGDTAVAIGTYSGTYKATGKPFSARVVHVFRVRDGKIAAFEQFADTLTIAGAKES
jgi:ketosteroid isomerase-like protein